MSKRVLVLGASSEIGKVICLTLSAKGWEVVAQGRNHHELNILSRASNGTLETVASSVDTEDERKSLMVAATKNGLLTDLVSCLGAHEIVPVGLGYGKSLERLFHVNTISMLSFVELFVKRRFSDSKSTRTLTVLSSIANSVGQPGLSGYGAAKSSLIGAVKNLAVELAPKNIRVNAVSPGWVDGNKSLNTSRVIGEDSKQKVLNSYPLGVGQPSDIANAVSFLCSDDARWITGINLVVDGGRSCA